MPKKKKKIFQPINEIEIVNRRTKKTHDSKKIYEEKVFDRVEYPKAENTAAEWFD